MKALALGSLQQNSNHRVAASSKFTEGKRLAQLATASRAKEKISLRWEDAEKAIKAFAAADREKIFMQPSSFYRVRNNTADQKLTTAIYTPELNNFWLKRLGADMYVEEAFQILSDFIQAQ